MQNSISHTLTCSSLLSPPFHSTAVCCITVSHLHTHHCCHLPTTVVLFAVFHSATCTSITTLNPLPQYCLLYSPQPLTHTSLLTPPYHSTVCCIPLSHIHTHHRTQPPTTVLFAVLHSAPYTPPSICDTIYVEELLLETNFSWVYIWHGFATPLHSGSSNLITNFNIFTDAAFISVGYISPCFNNFTHTYSCHLSL